MVSEQWPKFLLYFVSAGYFAMNIGLWYSTGFSWSQKGLPVACMNGSYALDIDNMSAISTFYVSKLSG